MLLFIYRFFDGYKCGNGSFFGFKTKYMHEQIFVKSFPKCLIDHDEKAFLKSYKLRLII